MSAPAAGRRTAPAAFARGDVRRSLRLPLRQKISSNLDAFYEIDEGEAEIVREIFDRDTERGESIADIVRALPADGLLTRTGKHVRDRSTV